MFDPSEVPIASKFALHVVRYERKIKIQKIPLLEIANDAVEPEVASELFIEPIGDHRAYLLNDILKVNIEFSREIEPQCYIGDNIRLYDRIKTLKLVADLNFQIVPIWNSVNWPFQFFRYGNPAEFMIYHPTWEKKYLADMVRCHNYKTFKSIAHFVENDPYE